MKLTRWLITFVIGCLLLGATGCSGGRQLTYRVTGTASEVAVEYRDAEGTLQQVAATPPWEVTLSVENEFSFELTAVRNVGSGDVACEVLLDGESLGRADGTVSATCEGSFRKQGGDLSTSFTSGSNTVLDERLDEAVDYAEAEQYDQAIAALQELLQIAPDDYRVHGNLGIVYYQTDQYDKAIAEFQEVLRLEPDDPNAYHHLGVIYANQGRAEEAIAAFETYLQLQPDASDRAQVEEWIAQLRRETVDLGAEYASPLGFSVRYPSEWTYVEMGEGLTSFLKSEEDMNRIVEEAPVIILSYGSLDELGENLDLGEITSVEQALQEGVDHFGAEGSGLTTFEVAGYPAGMVEMAGTMEGVPFRGSLAFVLVEDWGFAFTGMAPPDLWDGVAPIFEGMVRSLSLPNP